MLRSAFLLASTFLSVYSAQAAVYTANIATGSDANPGTAASPFKTLSKCVGALRAAGDVCELAKGTYEAGGVVTASGTSGNPVVIRARNGEDVVIQQGSVPEWVQSEGTLWSLSFGYANLLNAQRGNSVYYERGIRLWKDTVPLTEACFPNLPDNGSGLHPVLLTESGSSNSVILNTKIPAGDLRGARAFVLPYLRQVVESRRINSSGAGRVDIGTGYYQLDAGKAFYLVGSKALIDRDYEWAWDEPTGKVWIQLPPRVNPTTAKIRLQTSSVAFTVQGSNVSIQDLRFVGVVPVATPAATGVRYENLKIREAGILQFGESVLDYLQPNGLVLREGATLTRSTISGCDGRCVNTLGQGVVVTQNIVQNAVRLGQYEGAISIGGKANRIEANLIENSGRDGVGFMALGVENSIVRRNWIRNCGLATWDAAGITIGAHPNGTVTMDSNLIQGLSNEGSGVFLDEASQRNQIDHNVFMGVSVGITAQGNLVTKVYTSQNNWIWNNTLLSGASSFFAVRAATNLAGSRFSNNVTAALPSVQAIVNNAISSRVSSPSEIAGYGATWSGNLAAGIDPLLVAPANRNFGLQPGSPAIDIGDVGAWPFQGSRPDAGAVEAGTTPWIYGPAGQASVNPILGFEDASKWNPPSWDNAPLLKELSTDKVEGSFSLAVTPNGYRVLESAPLSQADVAGTQAIQWFLKLYSPLPNPWWVGQVSAYITCPSRGVYNAWIGQIELTPLPANKWQTLQLPLPGYVAGVLQGATYKDLSVSLVLNTVQGSGPILLDNLRFLP